MKPQRGGRKGTGKNTERDDGKHARVCWKRRTLKKLSKPPAGESQRPQQAGAAQSSREEGRKGAGRVPRVSSHRYTCAARASRARTSASAIPSSQSPVSTGSGRAESGAPVRRTRAAPHASRRRLSGPRGQERLQPCLASEQDAGRVAGSVGRRLACAGGGAAAASPALRRLQAPAQRPHGRHLLPAACLGPWAGASAAPPGLAERRRTAPRGTDRPWFVTAAFVHRGVR